MSGFWGRTLGAGSLPGTTAVHPQKKLEDLPSPVPPPRPTTKKKRIPPLKTCTTSDKASCSTSTPSSSPVPPGRSHPLLMTKRTSPSSKSSHVTTSTTTPVYQTPASDAPGANKTVSGDKTRDDEAPQLPTLGGQIVSEPVEKQIETEETVKKTKDSSEPVDALQPEADEYDVSVDWPDANDVWPEPETTALEAKESNELAFSGDVVHQETFQEMEDKKAVPGEAKGQETSDAAVVQDANVADESIWDDDEFEFEDVDDKNEVSRDDAGREETVDVSGTFADSQYASALEDTLPEMAEGDEGPLFTDSTVDQKMLHRNESPPDEEASDHLLLSRNAGEQETLGHREESKELPVSRDSLDHTHDVAVFHESVDEWEWEKDVEHHETAWSDDALNQETADKHNIGVSQDSAYSLGLGSLDQDDTAVPQDIHEEEEPPLQDIRELVEDDAILAGTTNDDDQAGFSEFIDNDALNQETVHQRSIGAYHDGADEPEPLSFDTAASHDIYEEEEKPVVHELDEKDAILGDTIGNDDWAGVTKDHEMPFSNVVLNQETVEDRDTGVYDDSADERTPLSRDVLDVETLDKTDTVVSHDIDKEHKLPSPDTSGLAEDLAKTPDAGGNDGQVGVADDNVDSADGPSQQSDENLTDVQDADGTMARKRPVAVKDSGQTPLPSTEEEPAQSVGFSTVVEQTEEQAKSAVSAGADHEWEWEEEQNKGGTFNREAVNHPDTTVPEEFPDTSKLPSEFEDSDQTSFPSAEEEPTKDKALGSGGGDEEQAKSDVGADADDWEWEEEHNTGETFNREVVDHPDTTMPQDFPDTSKLPSGFGDSGQRPLPSAEEEPAESMGSSADEKETQEQAKSEVSAGAGEWEMEEKQDKVESFNQETVDHPGTKVSQDFHDIDELPAGFKEDHQAPLPAAGHEPTIAVCSGADAGEPTEQAKNDVSTGADEWEWEEEQDNGEAFKQEAVDHPDTAVSDYFHDTDKLPSGVVDSGQAPTPSTEEERMNAMGLGVDVGVSEEQAESDVLADSHEWEWEDEQDSGGDFTSEAIDGHETTVSEDFRDILGHPPGLKDSATVPSAEDGPRNAMSLGADVGETEEQARRDVRAGAGEWERAEEQVSEEASRSEAMDANDTTMSEDLRDILGHPSGLKDSATVPVAEGEPTNAVDLGTDVEETEEQAKSDVRAGADEREWAEEQGNEETFSEEAVDHGCIAVSQDFRDVGELPSEDVDRLDEGDSVRADEARTVVQGSVTVDAFDANTGDIDKPSEKLDANAPALPTGWTELIDPNSGIPYYFHEADNVTTWERPVAIAQDDFGEASFSSAEHEPVKNTTFGTPDEHAKTDGAAAAGEWEWEDDDEFEDAHETHDHLDTSSPETLLEDEKLPEAGELVEDDAVRTDDIGNDAEGDLAELADDVNANTFDGAADQREEIVHTPLPPGWVELIDPNSGIPYYYNEADNTTTWEKPVAVSAEKTGEGARPSAEDEKPKIVPGDEAEQTEQQAKSDGMSGTDEWEWDEEDDMVDSSRQDTSDDHDAGMTEKAFPLDVKTTDLTMVEDDEVSPPLSPTAVLSPKFEFLSSVPTELKKLQEQDAQRRHKFKTSLHESDCQLASIQSRLAHESMDRDLALRNWMDRVVSRPLEAAAERVFLMVERDLTPEPRASSSTPPSSPKASSSSPCLVSLERRVEQLDTAMTKHVHETLYDAKTEQLDSVHSNLRHEVIPSLQLETAKADKREAAILRRYDAMAGTVSRQLQEEHAARRASLEMLQKRLDIDKVSVEFDQKKAEALLETVRDLRRRVNEERDERKRHDRLVLDKIVQTTATMKRALLEAVGDPS